MIRNKSVLAVLMVSTYLAIFEIEETHTNIYRYLAKPTGWSVQSAWTADNPESKSRAVVPKT
jgi:hypothetical protein